MLNTLTNFKGFYLNLVDISFLELIKIYLRKKLTPVFYLAQEKNFPRQYKINLTKYTKYANDKMNKNNTNKKIGVTIFS